MLDIREPTFTRRVQVAELTTLGITTLLYGADVEEDRASTFASTFSGSAGTKLWRVEMIDDALCAIHGAGVTINLYEASTLDALARGIAGRVALDLTSLEHRVWAPLTRAFAAAAVDVVALYAEPDEYRRSEELPGSVYDLSTSRGIDPLPGFARLGRRADGDVLFAPLLGFEGARLGHIFDQEEVEVSHTWPIVGSPGFRLEYPTYAFLANRDILAQGRMDQRVEFARASCPFEAYRAIERVHARAASGRLRVAPIGTKPHALGAVLYAIRHGDRVELIYDNPVRSSGRTRGTRGVYVYDVGGFLRCLAL